MADTIEEIDKEKDDDTCEQWRLVRENGVLLIKGGKPLDIDIVEFIRQEREERIRYLMGEFYQPPTKGEYGD